MSTGLPPHFETPLVVQVLRWDRLKDPKGVALGFAERSREHLAYWARLLERLVA